MKLTTRDAQLIREISLSYVMSRDQILARKIFSSVTRANTRLRELTKEGLVRRLDTPFFTQSLYMAGSKAPEIVGPNIQRFLLGRTSSPRFVQHALSVTNIRIALENKGAGQWRYEQQLRVAFSKNGNYQVRPDGMFLTSKLPIFIECDLGHVNPGKFKEKLKAYCEFVKSGTFQDLYKAPLFRLLTVTTGEIRSRRLRQLMPEDPGFEALFTTFDELNIPHISSWS